MFVVFTDAATMSVAGSARVLRGLKLSGSMALTSGLGFRALGCRFGDMGKGLFAIVARHGLASSQCSLSCDTFPKCKGLPSKDS